MNRMSERPFGGFLSRVWPRLACLLAAISLALGAFGCDRGSEFDKPDPQKEGVANTGDAAQGKTTQGETTQGGTAQEKSNGDLEVTKLELGKAINAEKAIERPTDTFAPDETVFVSIHVAGSSDNLYLYGRWYRGGEVFQTTEHRTSTNEGTITEMHIGEGPNPLPAGDYVVEVRLGETVVGSVPFKVVPDNE